jgi:hypothetical protein
VRGMVQCGANGVDNYVVGDEVTGRSGGGVDGCGLHGVAHDGTKATGLINLRCPIEPCGFVQHRVEHSVVCR